MNITKREGHIVLFDKFKIMNAIAKAMLETEEGVDESLTSITDMVEEKATQLPEITVEAVQDIVEDILIKTGKINVAKRYIIYREERAKQREKGWQFTDMQRAIWSNKYEFEKEGQNAFFERVSGGDKRIEIRIRKKQFSFGGRILANRGLHKKGLKVTYSNCYVLPEPKDNIESIWDTARDMARTYSYGGGVGIDISLLRPDGMNVHNNARTTSGGVSFMPLYSTTTETIGQKGRRGALMISVSSRYPDLDKFIDVKTKEGAITGANISIRIDNEFMEAVKRGKKGEDATYELYFKCDDTGEELRKNINALQFYERIIQNNIDWGEPGMLYWDRINQWHLMSAHKDFKFSGTNPCAEEPLPPGGSCLLGSINLSEFALQPFTEKATFDFPKYIEAIHDAVWALNNVLDEGLDLHPLDIQKKTVKELRQIGLGIMGLADLHIKMGMTYGSTRSLAFCEVLAHMLINEATIASADVAKERGSFDWYDYDTIAASAFFDTVMTPQTKSYVKRFGLRNSQILCIAPTGSLSSMLGISGGMEPLFALGYERTTKSIHAEDVKYWVDEPIVAEYRQATGNMGELPDYFVTAQNLDWRNRIEMQAVWQRYIDASISSTVNLPKGTTAEKAMDLYLYAWEMGLKGVTIFVDGCKRTGILTVESEETKKEEKSQQVETNEQTRATGYYAKCPDCGSDEMWHIDGCVTCRDCGFSPCS